MESQSDILLSLQTGVPKVLILQIRSNGVSALVNKILQMKVYVGICRPEGRYNYSRLSRVKWTSIPSILSEDQLPEDIPKSKFAPDVTCKVPAETIIYYINICEIPGFLLLLKNHISTARSEHSIFM